ncbi:universal stress protein [Saliphagus sp. LR7]|uniref:universal stress protein n=1 Tax=Saliphagus sp. LR7 TaxID=2282654 RepID=UPI000DF7F44B|nr:universal stress protein [Saliphagus sp. LR7]
MISRVLVPMDDSEMAERALRYALEAHPDSEVMVLHIVGEPSAMWGEATSLALADNIGEAADEHAKIVLDGAREIADEYDREITTEVQLGHPTRAILNRADGFDTIVMGSHGGTLADRLLVGNVAEKVFRRSPIPVTVVR